jgi:class 3 adenylate cyclase/tetratricopeptide (TPR) repeat protein
MVTCANCRAANADGARFCSSCGSQLEAQRPIEGERKFATVLFADVARSTAIAEQMDPEDWALIMNGAFAFMNAAIARYGGTVSRLLGDAVLALFGAPVAHEDDAERAVRAGLDLQEAARAYAVDIKARYGVDFALRVGINTGTAVLAFVGDAVRTEYTAMGDAANVAARLQSAAEPGAVLISADTQRLVHGTFEFVARGPIEMKGKLAPVRSFEVTGLKAVPESARGIVGLTSPLIGREREIGVLRARLAGLSQGRGGVVALIGEAGLGKSRLIAELRHAFEAEPPADARWLEARAISYGQSIPYYPWRQLGRQLLGSRDGDDPQALRDQLRALLERLAIPARNVAFLETMLAVETEESRLDLARLAGEDVANGVAGAVVDVVKAALGPPGRKHPQVVVMDDLHWSDTATLELIAQVAPLAAFEPLLFVCVLRPDRRAASWALVDRLQASLGTAFDRLELEPLDGSSSRELLGNLLHIEDLPESIRAQILARSEGNPFYLEEVLRSLIDDGQVVREADHWRATRDIIEATIPETLAGVLSSRIDRLPDATKRVAQTAAVIGRVFQHRVLESVCRAAPEAERVEHVEPHIATLSYEQLVRERARDPEREYAFKHALTCDAAYELLLKSRRRELHARAGAALEMLFADRRDEFAAMLAHHFTEADDARALPYARQAADTARRLYALREELMHRETIIKVLEKDAATAPEERIDAIHDWVRVRHHLNAYEGVVERLEQAVTLARAAGDKRRLGLSLSWIANIYFVTGFPSRSAPYLAESSALGQEIGNVQMVLLPMFLGTWAAVDRDPAAAAATLRDVVELARANKITEIEGHALTYLAVAHARLGDFDTAHRYIDEALAMLPKTLEPVKQADIHIGVGMALHDLGEFEVGLTHARLGAELAERADGLECACAGYLGAGRVELERHQLEQAHDDFIASLKYADKIGFEAFRNLIHGGVAMTECEQGRTAVIEGLRLAVNNAQATNDGYAAATMSEKLAAALLRLGRRDEAEAAARQSLDYYRSTGMRPFVARALKLFGEIHDARGDMVAAARDREEAAAIAAELASRRQGAAVRA